MLAPTDFINKLLWQRIKALAEAEKAPIDIGVSERHRKDFPKFKMT
jgi:hypothetical protein